jgi:hypothetical protein
MNPQAPEYTIRAVSNFFENSRRYSQIKVATGINNKSETHGKIFHRCRWYRWKFCCRCRWHRWKICHQCRWYRWCTLTCEYSEKFETILMGYAGAGGKLIHEKTRSKKSRDTVPLSLDKKGQTTGTSLKIKDLRFFHPEKHKLFNINRDCLVLPGRKQFGLDRWSSTWTSPPVHLGTGRGSRCGRSGNRWPRPRSSRTAYPRSWTRPLSSF